MRYLAAGFGVLLLMAEPLRAVLISGGDGSGNLTAPGDDFGFANVGIRGSGSAIYLENGWVLTAAHVGAGTTLFQNVWYNEVPGSAVQLSNPPGAGFGPYSDLMLYQIAAPPSLPSVMITQSAPAAGWQVTMAGNGRDRNASEAYWTSSWAPAITPSPYAGYIWSGTNDLRWGTNVITAVGAWQDIGLNSETVFSTTFDQYGMPYEAQGTPGDSGGGVFHQDASGAWSLAGSMFSINALPGEPWGVSVFGNVTYSADLWVYRSEIYHTMALPGDANFDGIVNGQDLVVVAENWMKTGTAASDPAGDANHDGIVNGQDIALIESNWTLAISGGSAGSRSAHVPEPSTIALAVLGGLALLARRRR